MHITLAFIFKIYSSDLPFIINFFESIYIFFGQYGAQYSEIIAAAKGTEEEKHLASRFIRKFVKYFPELAESAIDAMLDLCRDKNIQIRHLAFLDLSLLCKDTMLHIPKIVEGLVQLLVVDDQLEVQLVHMSLQKILSYDTKTALACVVSWFHLFASTYLLRFNRNRQLELIGNFNLQIGQILTGDEVTRDRCYKFLVKQLGKEIATDEVIIDELKTVLQVSNDSERLN